MVCSGFVCLESRYGDYGFEGIRTSLIRYQQIQPAWLKTFLFVQRRSLARTSLVKMVWLEKCKNRLGSNPLYGLGASLTLMGYVKEMGVLLLEELSGTPTGVGLVVLQ